MATKNKIKVRKRSTPAKAAPRRRRKSGLSAGLNKANLIQAIKSAAAAGAGGIAAPYANRAFSTIQNKWMRILLVGMVPAVGARMAGFSDLGSGYFGGIVALNTQSGILNEDSPEQTNFADENSLSETPIFLGENGVPMKMLEDGTLEELSADEQTLLAELMEE